jgi:hypothetical protein
VIVEPMTVFEAIMKSKRGIAVRWNRRTKKDEYAQETSSGVRIVKCVTDPTVVRKLPASQLMTAGWTPFDPKEELA